MNAEPTERDVEALREQAYLAAEKAASLAPVLNRNEAAFIAHMLTKMNVLRPAVDAAVDVVAERIAQARREGAAEAMDARGRTADCLPFCQGGLHEAGCTALRGDA